MGTESHGSEGFCLTPRSRFLMCFLRPSGFKDSRGAECDIVKVTKGSARFFYHGLKVGALCLVQGSYRQ